MCDVSQRRRYATGTKVPAVKSRGEIMELLERAGATSFGVGKEPGGEAVFFVLRGHQCVMRVPEPTDSDPAVRLTPSGSRRTYASDLETARAAEHRRRWRSLLLRVKARIEAVEDGDETFEQAFLPFFMLQDGRSFVDALPELRLIGSTEPALPANRLLVEHAQEEFP